MTTENSTSTNDAAIAWLPGQLSTRRRFVPNVPVLNDDGQRQLFYDDLVKDRIVIVHFFSLAYHPNYPVTRNLVGVQRLLSERQGQRASIISVTTDPERDGVTQIAEFARRHHAGPNWTFLTGEPADIEAIKNIFFFHTTEHKVDEHSSMPDCSIGLLRYGNDQAGLWGSVPAKSDPKQIVERLSWLSPSSRAGIRLKRGGPHPITTS